MKNLKGSAVNKIIKNIKKMWKLSTMFSKKKFIFFAFKKLKKTPSKVAQKNSNPLFSLLPAQPKQKNSCSKMWPIDQLYIDTQLRHTLDSGIDVAPGINVAPGTFGKNIKRSP